jgi:hypothetical protein
MLMDDVDLVLMHTARVLRRGGRLAVVTGGGPVPGGGVDLFSQLVRKYFTAVPKELRIPRFGDKRTRAREGLADLAARAGFGELAWESCAVERKATAADLWEEFRDSLYGMEALDREQLVALRTEFIDGAKAITEPDGSLPGGMLLNVVTATLAD